MAKKLKRYVVNKNGRVTIPKYIRELLKLKPGSRLQFDVNEDGELILRPVIRS